MYLSTRHPLLLFDRPTTISILYRFLLHFYFRIIISSLIWEKCGRNGYTGPTGRTGPRHEPPDPSTYSTHTSLALLLASCSRLVEVYPSF